MNFKERIAAVLQKLGLKEKAKGNNLSKEETDTVAATYKADYGTELEADADEWKKQEAKAAAFDNITKALAEVMAEEEEEDDDDDDKDEPGKEEEKPSKTAAAIVNTVKEMKRSIDELAAKAQKDAPVAVVSPSLNIAGRAHTSKHLFGIEHEMFSMDKRWNRVTRYGAQVETPSDDDARSFFADFRDYASKFAKRYNELHKLGLITVGKLGEVDYSALKDAGLGEQFVVRRQDELISRIVMLPSLDGIFPRRSNIQDEEVLTNAFFGEFSRSYQPGETSKGSMKLIPEKAKVHDAMFKYRIESFKWIERQYIGYMNTSGSDPIKWNMIEWLILNISTKLQQERNWRVINGYRIEPETDKTGNFNFAANGVVHTLFRYVEENKVLPFTGADVNGYTSANIGDVFMEFVEKVANEIPNVSEYVLYANKQHEPWFKAWYTSKYGGNADFTGVQNKVPDYDVSIVWVPNMGNIKLIFMSVPGNIMQLENVPGEMNKISFEPRLESVWAYSVWKEGVSATFSGKKYDTAADLEEAGRADQLIFMNMPVTTVAAGATTLAAKDGPFFATSDNEAATAITDISGAKEGVVYVIRCEGTANASTIAKSGKFEGITAAYTPKAKGDFLKVFYDGTKFIEVDRKVS